MNKSQQIQSNRNLRKLRKAKIRRRRAGGQDSGAIPNKEYLTKSSSRERDMWLIRKLSSGFKPGKVFCVDQIRNTIESGWSSADISYVRINRIIKLLIANGKVVVVPQGAVYNAKVHKGYAFVKPKGKVAQVVDSLTSVVNEVVSGNFTAKPAV